MQDEVFLVFRVSDFSEELWKIFKTKKDAEKYCELQQTAFPDAEYLWEEWGLE